MLKSDFSVQRGRDLFCITKEHLVVSGGADGGLVVVAIIFKFYLYDEGAEIACKVGTNASIIKTQRFTSHVILSHSKSCS